MDYNGTIGSKSAGTRKFIPCLMHELISTSSLVKSGSLKVAGSLMIFEL